MTDQRIKEILQQEAEIPRIVEKQAFDALNEIMMDCGAKETEKKGQRYGWMNPVKAAAAALVILAGAGAGVYAAGNYIGLFDFLAGRGMTKTAALEQLTGTESAGVSFSNDYVDYTVREAICDENVIYMIVEAVPKASDEYLLVPEDCTEEDSVTYLGIENMPDQTVGEYAELLGKELMHSSVGLYRDEELVSVTQDSKMTEDGAAYYCITGVNSTGADELDLTCVGTAYTEGMAVAKRAEAKCRVVNYTSSKKKSYTINDKRLETELGIILDEVEITETELGLYAKFCWHTEDENAETGLPDGGWALTDALGNELVSMPYYAGSGIRIFDSEAGADAVMTAAYQKEGREQEIFVAFNDYETDTVYGPYEMAGQ